MWMRLDVFENGENVEVQVYYSWVTKLLMMALTFVPLLIFVWTLSTPAEWDVLASVGVVCTALTLTSSVLMLSVFLSTHLRVGPEGVHISTPMGKQRRVPVNEVQFFIHEPFSLRSVDGKPNTGNHITAVGTYTQGELPGEWRRTATSIDPIRFGLGIPDEHLARLTEQLNLRLFQLCAAN
jgi:hypothetical protein